MKPSRMELLKRVYKEELKTDDVVCISLIGVNNPRALIEDSNQLIEEDYLTSPYKATRQLNLKLTDKGWDYVKNNFQSRDGVMSVSGDNNIIINGNSNTVKNNFNDVKVDISQAELTDEQKQQIIDLLDEIKNLKESGNSTKEKIHSLVANFAMSVASNIATAPFVELITSLCNNIPF